MTTTNPLATTGAGSTAPTKTTVGNSIADLDMDEFVNLMIAELQNQDPLDPLDNAQMLQQISQIREIGATDHLTQTLDAVLAGQELTTASNLIGNTVRAMDDAGDDVQGVVNRISIEIDPDTDERTLRAHIDSLAAGTTDALMPDARLTFTANSPGEEYNNLTVRFLDDGSVTQGNETVAFDAANTALIFSIEDGHTTAADILRCLDEDPVAGAAVSARLEDESDGAGLVSPAHTATLQGGTGHVVRLDNIREVIKPISDGTSETVVYPPAEEETTE